jgi:hypothetical protein
LARIEQIDDADRGGGQRQKYQRCPSGGAPEQIGSGTARTSFFGFRG